MILCVCTYTTHKRIMHVFNLIHSFIHSIVFVTIVFLFNFSHFVKYSLIACVWVCMCFVNSYLVSAKKKQLTYIQQCTIQYEGGSVEYERKKEIGFKHSLSETQRFYRDVFQFIAMHAMFWGVHVQRNMSIWNIWIINVCIVQSISKIMDIRWQHKWSNLKF